MASSGFNKKGWQYETVGKLILILLGAIALGYFVLNVFYPEAETGSEREICRHSVDRASYALEFEGTEFWRPFKIKCKTLDLHIKEKDDELIKKELSDHLYLAWLDFRSGKKNLFKEETKKYCHIRYAPITFEEKGQKIEGFLDYLNEESPEGKEQTYLELIAGHGTTQHMINKLRGDAEKAGFSDVINTDLRYAIIFTVDKEGVIGKPESAGLGTVIGAVFGFVTIIVAVVFTPLGGAAAAAIFYASTGAGTAAGYALGSATGGEFGSFISLVPYDNLDEIKCEVLI